MIVTVSRRKELAYRPKECIKEGLVYKFCLVLSLVTLLKNLRTPFK
jgi:hypothetical protein